MHITQDHFHTIIIFNGGHDVKDGRACKDAIVV